MVLQCNLCVHNCISVTFRISVTAKQGDLKECAYHALLVGGEEAKTSVVSFFVI